MLFLSTWIAAFGGVIEFAVYSLILWLSSFVVNLYA